jgi:hypothetical protein
MSEDTAAQIQALTERVAELERRAAVHEQRLEDAVRLHEILLDAGNPPPVRRRRRTHLRAVE